MSAALDNPLAADGVYDQWIACSRKRPFGTRKLASGTAKHLKHLYGSDLGIYRCEHCGQFHLYTKRGKR